MGSCGPFFIVEGALCSGLTSAHLPLPYLHATVVADCCGSIMADLNGNAELEWLCIATNAMVTTSADLLITKLIRPSLVKS